MLMVHTVVQQIVRSTMDRMVQLVIIVLSNLLVHAVIETNIYHVVERYVIIILVYNVSSYANTCCLFNLPCSGTICHSYSVVYSVSPYANTCCLFNVQFEIFMTSFDDSKYNR